ncbi:hypothetical protein RRG08_001873 [Elysia crispata]|uniref:Uncharacterized protein n=1 Tax=Elysia crispata TaxID=231223 RepID=A0AAE1A4G5_9GAST|nr:hypothetical protein RRG08_001873 [Elysia crispata]
MKGRRVLFPDVIKRVPVYPDRRKTKEPLLTREESNETQRPDVCVEDVEKGGRKVRDPLCPFSSQQSDVKKLVIASIETRDLIAGFGSGRRDNISFIISFILPLSRTEFVVLSVPKSTLYTPTLSLDQSQKCSQLSKQSVIYNLLFFSERSWHGCGTRVGFIVRERDIDLTDDKPTVWLWSNHYRTKVTMVFILNREESESCQTSPPHNQDDVTMKQILTLEELHKDSRSYVCPGCSKNKESPITSCERDINRSTRCQLASLLSLSRILKRCGHR